MRIYVKALLAVLFSFSSSQFANADPIIFTDRASFDAAIALRGTVSTNGFNSFFNSANSVDFGDFTISTPTVTGVVRVTAASEGGFAAGFQSTLPGSATIAFDSPINALGVDLVDWASNSGNIASGGVHTLSAMTNTGSFNQVLATAPPVRPDMNVVFLGLIDDTPFDSLTIFSTTGADTIGIDDMDYGLVSAVPEPSSAAIIASFLLSFSANRNRRDTR
jgi:hypothetical protein